MPSKKSAPPPPPPPPQPKLEVVLAPGPIKVIALPDLSGVAGLSAIEIKDDLREMQNQPDDNDTDSDSSIRSEDILESVYPVQPRYSPKPLGTDLSHFSYYDFGGSGSSGPGSGNGASVDESLYFLKEISKSQKELYEGEKQREELELYCQAFDANLDNQRKQFTSSRKEHENYLRILQGLFVRNVRLHSLYSRQSVLMHRIYLALQHQRAAETTIAKEIAKLKTVQQQNATAAASASMSTTRTARGGKTSAAAQAAAMAAAAAAAAAALPVGETSVLHVHLQKSNLEVILCIGQCIPTPMGEAVIGKIRTRDSTVEASLPFGVLFAPISRVVCWCRAAVSDGDDGFASAVTTPNTGTTTMAADGGSSDDGTSSSSPSHRPTSLQMKGGTGTGTSANADAGPPTSTTSSGSGSGIATVAGRHSLQAVQQHFLTHVQSTLTVPAREHVSIKHLLAQRRKLQQQEEDETGAMTDNDDSSQPSSDGQQQPMEEEEEEEEEEEDDDDDEGEEDDEDNGEEGNEQTGNKVLGNGDKENIQDEDAAEATTTAAAATTTTTEIAGEEVEESEATRSGTEKIGKAASATGGSCDTGTFNEKEHMPVFPLAVDLENGCNKSNRNPRKQVKKRLEGELADNFSQLLVDSLPLAFAPPSSLPYIASQLHPKMSTSTGSISGTYTSGINEYINSSNKHPNIEYATQALLEPYHYYGTGILGSGGGGGGAGGRNSSNTSSAVQLGSTGQLAWRGEVAQLRSALVDLGHEVQHLEREQLDQMHEVNRMRGRSSRLTTEAAALRLGMFTRRLAHRNNLSEHGIVLPPHQPSSMLSSAGGGGGGGGGSHANGKSGKNGAASQQQSKGTTASSSSLSSTAAAAILATGALIDGMGGTTTNGHGTNGDQKNGISSLDSLAAPIVETRISRSRSSQKDDQQNNATHGTIDVDCAEGGGGAPITRKNSSNSSVHGSGAEEDGEEEEAAAVEEEEGEEEDNGTTTGEAMSRRSSKRSADEVAEGGDASSDSPSDDKKAAAAKKKPKRRRY